MPWLYADCPLLARPPLFAVLQCSRMELEFGIAIGHGDRATAVAVEHAPKCFEHSEDHECADTRHTQEREYGRVDSEKR